MSDGINGGAESPPHRQNDAVDEKPAAPPSGGGDSAGFNTVMSTDEAFGNSHADAAKSVEIRVSGNAIESLKLENEEIRQNDKSGSKKAKSSVEDYDSILSEFDQFASKGAAEAVGYGYEIGDMVWGKVKSHPWWPGRIYNEAFASPSVRRSKREGHVLVAFFGDSSYGWFDPAELVPFEESFGEKSRQTASRAFVKAVEEAVDELSRRRISVLACRCRNEFNFWPASVEGYYVVDLGDYEPGIYSSSQINKARENFRPNEMLSFVQQLALSPKIGQHRSIEFIKNKATVLACRKAMYEEFDDTYAEAFGTAPVRPSRPTSPMFVDPSKAPLSGRLVIAEALGKGKLAIKPTSKPKDQAEKDKYLFKRRDEQIHLKTKKTISGRVGPTAHPLVLDGSGLSGIPMDSSSHQTSVSGIIDGQQQRSSDQASVVSKIRPSEGFKKLVQGGKKKAQVSNRNAGEMGAENATSVAKKKRKKDLISERPAGDSSAENVVQVNKKRKKEMKSEVSASDTVQLPLSNGDSGEALEKVSGMLLDVPVSAPVNQVDNQKNKDGEAPSSSSQVEAQALDVGKVELSMLLRNLGSLALNPFHGVDTSCRETARRVFLKYRSLVYQKSLVLSPVNENQTKEAHSRSHASTVSRGPSDKTSVKSTTKLTKPSVRPDDPTKGGKKRLPSDRPEPAKKKRKLVESEDMNSKKKPVVSEDTNKKKIIVEPKMEKKATLQKPIESQRGPAKQITAKNASPTLPKPVKLVESIKRNERCPTMLVMKFPAGAALPSGAELRAKFARFGQLDHSATRVFWKSYTCRLVYQQKAHAQAALEFAVGSGNLFGNTNVRSYIREVAAGGEAVEPEPPVVNKVVDNAPGGEQRMVVPPSQLKSCLKKPSGEEGGGGNGNGRGTSTRVKFNILGGEGGGTSNNNTEGQVSSSFPDGAYTYTHSMDVGSSKNLPNFIPELAPLPTTTHQFRKFPINMPTTTSVELPPRSFNARPTQHLPSSSAPVNDISKQFLNLLSRCSDVVNNLTGVLGYVPYHSL